MREHVERYYRQAYLQWENGHIDGAIETLRRVLSQDPEFAEAHAVLAMCLLQKRRIHAARYEADLALSLEPDLLLAHHAMANILMMLRKFSQAEQHLNLLLDQDPNEALYYRNLAALYELKGQENKMLPLLEKALELQPQEPGTMAELSEYYLRRDLSKAEAYAHNALQIAADNVDALVAMGHVLLEKKRYDEAREHAVWALRNDPDNASALYLLSAIKAKNNWFLGLWWRYNAWMIGVGSTRAIIVLLLAFIMYRVATIISHDIQREDIASVIQIAWMAIVIYTFVGPALFNKSLKKEMAAIQLSNKF